MPQNDLDHLPKALRKRWKRYRKALGLCQDKLSEESLHACRVQARRLRATLELLNGLIADEHLDTARHALKRHLDALDELRDTQVQLRTVGTLLRTFPSARPFYNYLLEREAHLRKATGKAVRHIRVRRLERLIAACRADVKEQLEDRPRRDLAALLLRSVARAFAHTRQRRARIKPGAPRSIHRTRVAFKKFRYMVEELADYVPGPAEARLAAMQHYQSMMGDVQDAEVLLRRLDKFLRKQQITPEAASRFREELLRRRQWLIRVYLGAADQLLGFWPLPHSDKAMMQ